jgi:ferric-dicitrate binding protein FerR (iron transport regulator)
MAGTATPEQVKKWEALTRDQPAYAALIPWLQQVQARQQEERSPFYAADAWQQFKTTLPVPGKIVQLATPQQRKFPAWQRAAIAAAILLITTISWWLYPALHHGTATAAPLITYTVPNGKKQLLTLPDSTQIWINAGSSVQVPAAWGQDTLREVWLNGESFFEVRGNAALPFVVHTATTTIRVLGTSFNIEAYRQASVAVTVNTGKVQFAGSNGQTVILSQNQRSVWHTANGQFETVPADASRYNGWREGILQFSDVPLEQVMATLERRFNVQIKRVGTIKSNQYCTAQFTAGESLDHILESLSHIYGLEITRQANSIIIQSR